MKKVTVKRLGIGMGAGEPVEILPRAEIERIIDDLDRYEVFKIAYNAWIPGSRSGECQLDLRTGTLQAGSYSVGEMDQAIDSVNITLYAIDQNEDFDGLLDQDGEPYDIEEVWPEDLEGSIEWLLDQWYNQETEAGE